MEAPAVSAVVPCFNEVNHIEDCLRSLLAQEAPPGGFEVVVVDGMSEDGTRQTLKRLAAEHPQLRLVDNPRRITPCGMNCGIKAARGRWIAILGSHNRYAPDYLVRCLEVAEQTHAENVGGGMLCEAQGRIQQAIATAHHSFFSVGGARWHNPAYEGPADTVFGGFFKRELFERIGLFDEEMVRNQDDELNLRLTRAGGRIWQSPRIRSWYQPRKSLLALFRQYKQYGYWKVRVIQKHHLPASWRHLVPGSFVFGLGLLLLLSSFCLLPSCPHLRSLGRASLSGLSIVVATYLGILLLASALAARNQAWGTFPLLPAVFACYHLGYGYGFLRGIWDFVLRRQSPAEQFIRVTRNAPPPEKEEPNGIHRPGGTTLPSQKAYRSGSGQGSQLTEFTSL